MKMLFEDEVTDQEIESAQIGDVLIVLEKYGRLPSSVLRGGGDRWWWAADTNDGMCFEYNTRQILEISSRPSVQRFALLQAER